MNTTELRNPRTSGEGAAEGRASRDAVDANRDTKHGAPKSLSAGEMRRIVQYKIMGTHAIPEEEIARVIEAHVIHGLTPRQMRKIGLTTMSEYFINKCLVNSGVITAPPAPVDVMDAGSGGGRIPLEKTLPAPRRAARRPPKVVMTELSQRLAVIEKTLEQIAHHIGITGS